MTYCKHCELPIHKMYIANALGDPIQFWIHSGTGRQTCMATTIAEPKPS